MKNLLLFVVSLSLITSCVKRNQTDTTEVSFEQERKLEVHRPQFHFTPAQQWMNDPNGMVFYEGEYHLFYQHYPDSTVWGPMHWGHAVSTDLVNWKHLPIALYPDSLGLIFSGSAVIDWKNTSGLGQDGKPPMIAIYTYHHMEKEKAGDIDFQYQGMAYSNDKGRTWTKYAGNPIIPNPGIRDFRDPKVIWDDASQQWIMIFSAWDHSKIYGSKNLKDWKHLSDFGTNWGTHAGVWECPDIFPMQVEGTDETKWVLLQSLNPGSFNGGSGTQYFIGHFDGKTFQLDSEFAQALGKEPAHIPKGTLFENFENGYGDWVAEGEAFGSQPVEGTFEGQNPVEGYKGNYLVNSFFNGDKTTGKLTSPPFIIKQEYINFLIGGGNDKLRTCMNLVIDGQTVRSASGSNGELLRWKGWQVSNWIGKTAHIELIDTHTGGWGHINVDEIYFADALVQPEREKAVWLDYGRDNYAGVTWSDIPQEDGRRIFIGWMSNWDYAQVVPTESWRSATTLPRALTLRKTEDGLRLFSNPVKELQQLRKEKHEITGTLKETQELAEIKGSLFEINIDATIVNNSSPDFHLKFYNELGEAYRVGYNSDEQYFYSDRTIAGKKDFSTSFAKKIHKAPYQLEDNRIQLQLYIDVASAELFAANGLVVLTDIFFPTKDFTKVAVVVENGVVEINEFTVYELKEAEFREEL